MRVLLIENNLSNCLIARAILERDGFEVRVATNGEDGLALSQQTHFDVVLLDIVMPEMDGIQTLEELRRSESQTGGDDRPFFFALTAYDGAEDMQAYLSKGFDGLISKPLRPGDVERSIQICVENETPALNLRSWSHDVAEHRPLLDWTIIENGPGLASEETRSLILSNYRNGLSRSLTALSDALPGCLEADQAQTKRFKDALHSLRSASLTIDMARAPHLAGKLRDLPTEQLVEGMAQLLFAVRDSLPAIEDALRNPGSIAPREPGVIVQMRR
jgi:CheY-like chemotaxis protein